MQRSYTPTLCITLLSRTVTELGRYTVVFLFLHISIYSAILHISIIASYRVFIPQEVSFLSPFLFTTPLFSDSQCNKCNFPPGIDKVFRFWFIHHVARIKYIHFAKSQFCSKCETNTPMWGWHGHASKYIYIYVTICDFRQEVEAYLCCANDYKTSWYRVYYNATERRVKMQNVLHGWAINSPVIWFDVTN